MRLTGGWPLTGCRGTNQVVLSCRCPEGVLVNAGRCLQCELCGQPSVSLCGLAKNLVGEGWEESAPPGPGSAEQRSEAQGQAAHLLGVLPSVP